MKRRMCEVLLSALIAGVLYTACGVPEVEAQWQTPQYTVPIGRGTGVTGFNSAAPGTIGNVLTSNGAAVNPSFQPFVAPPPAGPFITAAPYNAACDGATDDRAAIQAAIDATPATGWTIYVPAGRTCNFGSTLNFKGHSNLKFAGFGGISPGGNTPARLIYTGTATPAMDFRDSAANAVSGMTIFTNNAAFSGVIVAADSTNPGVTVSSLFNFTDVTIGNLTSAVGTCLDISEAIEVLVERVNFSRCGPGIQGMTVLGQNTVVTIRNSQFANTISASNSIIGCGESWLIQNNAFEARLDGSGSAFQTSSALPCKGIVFDNNWFGDVTIASGTWIALTAQGGTIRGGRIATGASSTAIALTAGTGYVIEGVSIEGTGTTTAVSCTTSPTGGTFKGNTLLGGIVPFSGTCVNFNDREGNSPSTSAATSTQVLIGQSSDDAAWKTISGDVTVTAAGVTAIGTAKVTMAMLATMATNTVNGNATSGSASPTALAVPSCSTAASALKWTTNTGFGCNTAIDAANATNVGVTDTSTNATMFPAFMSAATGNLPVRVTSARWAFNPNLGSMSIGHATPRTDGILAVGGALSSVATAQYAMVFDPTFSTSATSNGVGFYVAPNTAAGSYTQTALQQIYIDNGNKGAGSTITNQYMLFISAPTLGTNKYAIYSGGGAVSLLGNLGVGADNIGNAAGSIQATDFIKSSGATAGIGYTTGAGGTVTQITSRTTGVTLNKASGAITMFSAAGSATAASFTVTNSAVAATDTIILNQKSGTNLYNFIVTTVGAGSFVITFFTTGGTATDAPVINFNVIKGSAS